MTRDEIMALSLRELDAAIAERVCGWSRINGLLVSPHGGILVPYYSTDLKACREAELSLHGTGPHLEGGRAARLISWYRAMRKLLNPESSMSPYHEWELANADAATRCRAMLLALEVK